MILGFTNILVSVNAASVTTVVTQKILPGSLSIDIPSYITFSYIISNIDTAQVSTALLKNIIISDLRKTEDIDWAVSASCSDLVAINNAVKQTGSNDTVSSGGTYNDSTGGTYRITITSGGKVGVAKYAVSGLESMTNLTTGKYAAIGTHGVTAIFASAMYLPGDSWVIRVDTIPASNLTIIPRSSMALSGSPDNVGLGNKHKFSGKNDYALIMRAPAGQKVNNFSTDLLLSLNIPPFTYANTYTATLTITSN